MFLKIIFSSLLRTVFDMRIITITILSLVLFASARADAADIPSSSDFSKVELVQELALGGMKKLLGWSGGNFYFAKKDGSVSVVDKNGKELFALQAKDGKGGPILKQPEAVAVSEEVIYVVDSETNLVAMFALHGTYKGSFGAKKGGFFGKVGGLSSPHGIAAHDGIIYVADSGNGRIQMFGNNGVFLSTLEIDSAPENNAAREKELPYKLHEPTEIVIDALGQIYVLDTDDALIKVYSPNGAYLKHLTVDGKPQSISIAHDGIYVADRDSLAIHKYDFNGKQMYSFGSRGKGRAQFKSIAGLATDQDRLVIIGDSAKGVADIFMVESAVRIEPVVKHPSRISVRWEQAIPLPVSKTAWDGKEAIYGIEESDKKNRIVKIVNGAVAGEINVTDLSPVSVVVDRSGAVWALDKKKSRIVKLDESGNILASIGTPGSRKGELDDAEDFAVSNTGIIFVADSGNSRVQAFSSDGVFLKEIRSDVSGKLDEPVAIALDPQNGLYVLDKGRSVVSIYSAKGEPLGVFGKQPDGSAILAKPVALMATQDEVFVLDSNQVKVFSHKGQYIRSFADGGSGPGELAEPVAITATGDTTFVISERGNKRLQAFTTLHKLWTPEQLTAQGAVHAIELRWAASLLPYVKQYRIYRSQSENSAFVQIATSNTNQYVDQGMEADKTYYYRVAGETHYGYVGLKSDAVNGAAKKYVPPILENVQVTPSSWQLKIQWKSVDNQYFSAYLIYQKDGDTYTRIGETTLPEFVKDSLIPDTKYTYYISTRSTDGTESDKISVTASTLPFNTAPLEIEVVKLRDIFSNTYKLYEQDGVGRIKLTNYTNKTIENIKVSFLLNNFMDFPTEVKIDTLLPGQSEEVTLKAVFNNNILTITEDSSIQAMVEASYFQDGKRVAFNKNPTITVYDKHRMTWDEHDRVASFVTPKDAPIINFVRSIATQFSETKDESQLAAVLFDAMGVIGLTYILNPIDPYQISLAKTETTLKTDTVDYVQYPRETLERKSGDCVDLVTFYSSALESMGISTLMVEVPDHILMMFSTGINADPDGYTMDDMYVIHDGKLWIPVEVTVVGKPFIKAWELGASNYYKWKDKGLTILDVHNSWNTYKPATLPGSTLKTMDVTSGDIEKKFPGDYMSMLKISSRTKTRRYLQAIEQNPADMDAHLQMGIILAKLGDREEAMKYFDKILSSEPKNAAALNNRGNVLMLNEKYAEAQKAYLAATQASPGDPYIWVNLAKSYKAVNDTKKAKAAFVKAQGLDPSIKVKYKALALELLPSL
ncbi:MAG: tetratricopeptide repeat protein [Gallionella sp.]|nr:tetratricopeptide repeat protein [Gallionella sp.]